MSLWCQNQPINCSIKELNGEWHQYLDETVMNLGSCIKNSSVHYHSSAIHKSSCCLFYPSVVVVVVINKKLVQNNNEDHSHIHY